MPWRKPRALLARAAATDVSVYAQVCHLKTRFTYLADAEAEDHDAAAKKAEEKAMKKAGKKAKKAQGKIDGNKIEHACLTSVTCLNSLLMKSLMRKPQAITEVLASPFIQPMLRPRTMKRRRRQRRRRRTKVLRSNLAS
jgi:hypothetical protein